MATPADQHDAEQHDTDQVEDTLLHDTLVLTHDTVVLPRPHRPDSPPLTPAAQWGDGSGWQPSAIVPPPATWESVGWSRSPMYGASAWSQVPPFVPASASPVLVMRNNAAVVGATLGSVSLFLSLIPLIGIVAWVLAPIGLFSSGVGLLVGVSRKVGRVGALWGLLTSGVALLVCMAWAALLVAL
jgi:hypothetical protein